MATEMAITHADLDSSMRRPSFDPGQVVGIAIVLISILGALSTFFFSLAAELSRSTGKWMLASNPIDGEKVLCVYGGDGKTPSLCALGAFVVLGIAMLVQQAFIISAARNSASSPDGSRPLVAWMFSSSPSESLHYLETLFFGFSWVCFSVAEVLLLIGIVVESNHSRNWRSPKSHCLLFPKGFFLATGILGIFALSCPMQSYLIALWSRRKPVNRNTQQQNLEAHASQMRPPSYPIGSTSFSANSQSIQVISKPPQ
ncbi:uncharacterized protein LOC18445132 [Amborella trichopoda]|uniref:Uncharacterized protein n=1 Tax=Amborella trichopoda TaxID=13333 RepID=U5D3I4_AMBTC|nr:uncharacterized protein LOC18445132 [Amborella trichopoda]ERN16805.1 hypothetical protein AMTR_s00057p00093030 [Amborella trichopoda]|eukprot:XP_006855338.3 uncharacterized protein LOC18445132 [Amborella trichopoda]